MDHIYAHELSLCQDKMFGYDMKNDIMASLSNQFDHEMHNYEYLIYNDEKSSKPIIQLLFEIDSHNNCDDYSIYTQKLKTTDDEKNAFEFKVDTPTDVSIAKAIYIDNFDISKIDEITIVDIFGNTYYNSKKENMIYANYNINGQIIKCIKLSNLGFPLIKDTQRLFGFQLKCNAEIIKETNIVLININNKEICEKFIFGSYELYPQKYTVVKYNMGLIGLSVIHEEEPSEKYKKIYEKIESEIEYRINYKLDKKNNNFKLNRHISS